MNLDDILKYQELDQKIYKDEVNLSRSPEASKIAALKQQTSSAKQAIIRLDKEAADIFVEIENISEQLDMLASRKKSLFNLSNINEISQADNAEDNLKEYLNELNSLEEQVKKDFKRLAEINQEASKQFEIGKNCNTERVRLQGEYMSKLNAVYDAHKEQIEQMNALKTSIDSRLVTLYNNLRENRKMPAFVEYNNGSCSACGMHIQIEVEARLKNKGDIAECPNCRRVVYLK